MAARQFASGLSPHWVGCVRSRLPRQCASAAATRQWCRSVRRRVATGDSRPSAVDRSRQRPLPCRRQGRRSALPRLPTAARRRAPRKRSPDAPGQARGRPVPARTNRLVSGTTVPSRVPAGPKCRRRSQPQRRCPPRRRPCPGFRGPRLVLAHPPARRDRWHQCRTAGLRAATPHRVRCAGPDRAERQCGLRGRRQQLTWWRQEHRSQIMFLFCS